MKILIFAEVYYPDVMGGGEFSTKQMAEGLAAMGHEIVVFCLGEADRNEEINGVLVRRRYLPGLSEHFLSIIKISRCKKTMTHLKKCAAKWPDLFYSKRWYERYLSVIKQEQPDAVHTASPMAYLGLVNLWKAAYDSKLPVSHTARSDRLLKLNAFGGRLDGFYARKNAGASSYLTALATPSHFMLDCHHSMGIRGRRFNEVIYNAVDFDPIPLSAELVKQKENMVLYAGEISEKKGIRTLLQAMDKEDDLRLLLIGNGALADTLKKEGRADMIGWIEREALYAYMKKAKVVVLPSKWNEPFGRILVEALFHGTIAIGSDRGGIPEVLGHNGDYMFESGDSAGLRGLITRVVHLSERDYVREVLRQRQALPDCTGAAYTKNWERFFLQQLI